MQLIALGSKPRPRQPRQRRNSTAIAAMAGRFATAVLLTGLAVVAAWSGSPRTETVDRVVPSSAEQVRLSFAPVVRRAAPAVVNIYSRKVVQSRPVAPFFDDPFLRRFFGDRFGGGVPRQRIENSLGSGVIVDSDGVIVTNRHVISGAQDITVVLADRREFAAVLLGEDDRTDLAVLQIEPEGDPLEALPLRDSDEVEVGDLVLAIGNPFGVGQTVTSGIVSALARSRVGIGQLDFFIQTDAAINPGNSGGALVDGSGELIGINTAIYSKSGGSLGIGFAIPSNLVRAVVSELRGDDDGIRPWLGAWGREVTADIAEALDLDRPAGILVEEVYQNGPADRAGLRPGDIILAVDDHAVDTPQALRYRLVTRVASDKVTLEVLRRGGDRQRLFLEALPAPEDPPRETTRLTGAHPLAGAVVANMSPALAVEMGLRRVRPGVVVVEVERVSVAARAGFRRGDRILEINGARMGDVRALGRLVSQRARRWSIRLARGAETLEWLFRG